MYPSDAVLRRGLLANAAFSGGSALILALAAPALARTLGQVSTTALYVIAAGLGLFALDLASQGLSARLNPRRALLATVSDLAWVAGSGALLLFWPHILTWAGEVIVVGVALVVLGLAAVQMLGLRRYTRNLGDSVTERTADADRPAESV